LKGPAVRTGRSVFVVIVRFGSFKGASEEWLKKVSRMGSPGGKGERE